MLMQCCPLGAYLGSARRREGASSLRRREFDYERTSL